VEKVYPELVIRDASGTIQGVHYEELAPMLLSKLQQEQALAERQQQTIASQQRAIDDLRTELGQIKRLDERIHSALAALQAEAARVAAR
jgi:HPt (histidine-containing phosphotransfer) domain-containing protein